MEYLVNFFNVTTISLCVVCKIPQILAIGKTKSIKGLSVTSIMVELFGYSIVLGYNLIKGYPYSAFLEYVFLVLQDVILLIMIFYLLGTLDVMKLGSIGAFLTIFYGFTLGIPHPSVLPILINFVTPISASSKIMALQTIWKSKNSDSVSVATWLIAAYTCVSRIFTTSVQTGDVALLVTYSIALVLNTAVILSVLYFRIPEQQQQSPEQKKNPEVSKSSQINDDDKKEQ